MKDTISYVIRTKNEAQFLEETCQRIRKQSNQLIHEIVIVDSGSTDNTLNIAEKWADKVICISPEDFTWGLALNKGIEYAKGNYVCLISGHCFIESDTTMYYAYKFLDNSDYCCIYGKQKGNFKLDKMEVVELFSQYPESEIIDSTQSHVPGVSNACCLLKKNVWEIYKFDEVTQSAEDALWFHTVLENELKVAYFPQFCVIHGHPFDINYMYRKWYWRTYKSESILCRNRNWKTSNYFRFTLSFIFAMIWKKYIFMRDAKKAGVKIEKKACNKYFLIRECARIKAKIDLKKNRNTTLKYAELKVPGFIQKIQNYIKEGEFYDI
ncbi:glycosyltransferase family 2 protein [Hungatella hathewayi]|uniref:glycosyltransferase family 2 protein n=1 Tax=Hungatella hathewayi TaxID=154046 RepID=UPI0015861B70|nr:glycosyltransferase family 2 protein [Hungatella hathewayi]MBS4983077.1 glycosyltransferase family 2 protein [Hungatella hathewayi]